MVACQESGHWRRRVRDGPDACAEELTPYFPSRSRSLFKSYHVRGFRLRDCVPGATARSRRPGPRLGPAGSQRVPSPRRPARSHTS